MKQSEREPIALPENQTSEPGEIPAVYFVCCDTNFPLFDVGTSDLMLLFLPVD
jgi:hypothetical protein